MDFTNIGEQRSSGTVSENRGTGKAGTVCYLHFDQENGAGPWVLDRLLLAPVFNLAVSGGWDRYLRNVRSENLPIAGDYGFRLTPLTAVLLFCCLKAVRLQGASDTSDSKESLMRYLRERYPGYDRASSPFFEHWDSLRSRKQFGDLLVNMLSKALDIRSRSSESLEGVSLNGGDLPELVWEEMLSVASYGEKALLSGESVCPCYDKGEIISSVSLDPCFDVAVNSEFLAGLYDIQSCQTQDPSGKLNEAAFLLSAGLVHELRSLCGDFTPGMMTELFADGCPEDGCGRCRILPGTRHYIVPGVSGGQAVPVPGDVPGLIGAGRDSYYPPFTAVMFCCGYLEEVMDEDGCEEPQGSYDEHISPETGENYEYDNPTGESYETVSESKFESESDKLADSGSEYSEEEQDDPPDEDYRPVFNDSYADPGDTAAQGTPYTLEQGNADYTRYEEEDMPDNDVKTEAADFDSVSVEDYTDESAGEAVQEEATVSVDKPLTPDDFWSQEDEDAAKDKRL